ncbi:unnamed protein product [Arabidopsis lyrata]|nr:unnamed protein product [Arabidopsis lyrata]
MSSFMIMDSTDVRKSFRIKLLKGIERRFCVGFTSVTNRVFSNISLASLTSFMSLITLTSHSGVSLAVPEEGATFAFLTPPVRFLCSTARLLRLVFSVRHKDIEDWELGFCGSFVSLSSDSAIL